MSADAPCARCGAALPVPPDLSALSVRCRYCGVEQPVPDIAARRAALAQQAREEAARRLQSEAQASALDQQRSARRTARWAALPGVFMAVVCVALGVIPALRMNAGHLLTPAWDGKSTLDCGGNEEVTITGVSASLAGTAVVARDNCHVTFERCQIKADTAIDASGNAHVLIRGGSIDGAVAASGNASIDNRGGRASGKVRRAGNAHVTGIP